jgi:hypothetical protein
MEMIVLNVGPRAPESSARLYGIFLLMAIATTAMTGPIVRVLHRTRDARDVGHRAARTR